ncbi:MAG: sensor histidine kinase, partial [Bacteroidales bacterium]
DLKKAKEKAEESDRLKSSFLANMSHEIRTPMNAIIGFTSMLNDPGVDKDTKDEMISQINLNGYALLNLIDNIIELAKIDANQLEIKKEKINVNELIENIYETFYESAQQKKLEFKYSLGIQNDVYLFTDAYRLKQAFPGEIKSLIIRVLRICEMNNNTKNY